MQRDAYRLPLSTGSAEAAGAFDRGVDGLLSWDRRTVDFFRDSAAEDPGLAAAHAGLAAALFVEEEFGEARAAMAAARDCAAGGSEREQSQVGALDHYVHLRPGDAEAAMRAHLASWPNDLMIAQRLYLMWFFQGRFAEMGGLTESLLRVLPDDAFVLGLHAFVLEEQGDGEEAVRWSERCIERNPEDTWGVHALTHALYELRAYEEALERVPPAIDACVNMNYYRNHMLWHLVLFQLAIGGYDRASEMCRDFFELEPSPRGLDLRNTVSTLWRFELYGMELGDRWRPFVEILKRQLDRPQDSPFHHAHVGMALAGGRDWETAEDASRHPPRTRQGIGQRHLDRRGPAPQRGPARVHPGRVGPRDREDRADPGPDHPARRQQDPARRVSRHPARGGVEERRHRPGQALSRRAPHPSRRAFLEQPRLRRVTRQDISG